MATSKLSYREWEFEVDREMTQLTYEHVIDSGADTCACNDCKNYVAYRNQVFPDEILKLLIDLGIDYRKEVETFTYEILPSGLHHISGWFHFKGRVTTGPDCRILLPAGGAMVDLIKITECFALGFSESSTLTYFEDKAGLVQVEFEAFIPWVIDKGLESAR